MHPPVTSLYDLPEIYAALLRVGDDEYGQIAALLDHYDVHPTSVLDPACGPGAWLRAFHDRGCRVAGNDLRTGMVAEARRWLPDAEFVVGDMAALALTTGPFDLAINLSSSVGHLESDEAALAHLRSVHDHLRPGGAYLLEVSSPLAARARPRAIWTSTKVRVGAGHAKVSYRSVCVDPEARVERIRLELTTWNLPAAKRLVELYDLRTFPQSTLQSLAVAAGFQIEDARRPAPDSDDLLALLRR